MAAVADGSRAPGRLRRAVTGKIADLSGAVAGRVLAWSPRTVPGLAGAGLVAYGAAMVYLPAGVIAGGLFLLMLDRRL